ncbi:MAG: hypothetical protein HOQ09_13740 [Gemmatimonadaceae bacterium]|nr:hypothetical protein [Gemmatimonadaceae bacterium]
MTRERRRAISAGLIALGALLRLWQFFGRGSFWLDEAAVARNVTARSYRGLLAPLDYAQIAPKGFLFVEKLATTAFGTHDWVFRLWSILTALAALPLFYALARRVLDERGALLALGLFAVLGRPIYYASEAKQYGSDIFFACLLLLLALRVPAREAGTRHWLRLGVLGAVAVWFSQPSLFILAGVAIALALAVHQQKIPLRWPVITACVLWAVSGLPSIWLTLHSLRPTERVYMHSFWSDGFWPLPPRSLADAAWPFVNLYGLFRDPLGMPVTALGIGMFVLGCIVLGRRRPVTIVALVAPIAADFVAAALGIYPVDTTVRGFNRIAAGNGRVLLFLVPGLAIVVVAGVMALVESGIPWVHRVGLVAAAVVVGAPAFYAATELPYSPNDVAPLFRVLDARARPGDELYVYYGGRQAFEWYRDRVHVPDDRVARGGCYRTGWREYLREVDAFRGEGRLWLLVAHPASIHHVREMDDVVTPYLDRVARRVGRWGAKDAYLLLYDMRNASRPPGPPSAWHPPPRRLASADTITLGWSCMGVFPGPGIPGTVVRR